MVCYAGINISQKISNRIKLLCLAIFFPLLYLVLLSF